MIVRELLVSLGLQMKGGEFKKAEGAIEKLKQAAIGFGVVFAGKKAFGLLEDIVNETTSQARSTELLAQSFGIATSSLEKLQYAAGDAAEALPMAFRLLSNEAQKAADGNAEATEKFKKFGIALYDNKGHLKDTEQLFRSTADAIQKTESPTRRVQIATELFGRSGAQLIPKLLAGSKGLDKYGKELEDLGGVMSQDFLNKSKEYRGELKKQSIIMEALNRAITSAVLPGFTAMVRATNFIVASFIKVEKRTDFLKVLFISLGVVAGLVAVAVALPFIEIIFFAGLAIVAFLGLVLLIEDFYQWVQGNGSLMEKIFGKYDNIDAEKHPIGKFIHDVIELIRHASENWDLFLQKVFGKRASVQISGEGDSAAIGSQMIPIDMEQASKSGGFGQGVLRHLLEPLLGAPAQQYAMPSPLTGGGAVNSAPTFNVITNVSGGGGDPEVLGAAVAKHIDSRIQQHADEYYNGLVPSNPPRVGGGS